MLLVYLIISSETIMSSSWLVSNRTRAGIVLFTSPTNTPTSLLPTRHRFTNSTTFFSEFFSTPARLAFTA